MDDRNSYKRAFLEFLYQNIYKDEIKAMISHKRHRLVINISDLHAFQDFGPRILRNPSEYMQPFCDAATDMARSIDPKYLKEGKQVLVGFQGPFVSRRVTPRELLSEFIGSMICVEGIVNKCITECFMERKERGRKRDTLTMKFLKKYIHYAKHRIQPELIDEASEHIATAYAELRNASSAAKTGGTLPITARTLETVIHLSTAHAKLKLSRKVSKFDVEAALKVLNFAIYHKELTEMEEHEQEREREVERKQQAERRSNRNAADDQTNDDDGGLTTEAMEVDDPPTEQASTELSPERIEAFNSTFREHMRYLDSISIDDLEKVVNTGMVHYTREQIMVLLQKLHDENKVMIADGMVHMVIS